MSIIELFWHLDVSDRTKYQAILASIIIIGLICVVSGKKKSKKKIKKEIRDKEYQTYMGLRNPSPCQVNYMKCVTDNAIKNTRNFCYPCLNDGTLPDFFYNTQINQWVKLT